MTPRTLVRTLSAAMLAAVLFAAACGGDTDATEEPAPEVPTPVAAAAVESELSATPPTGPAGVVLPSLDLERHTVPLELVFFDTFNGGIVRLDRASEALIDRLRDAIAPLYFPSYDRAEGGDWLEPLDLVIGYVGPSGQAYAYPHKILNFHELVNDEIDGVPVLISYCPLCRSGVVFDRELGGETLVFGNTSALYETDLVMFDWQTNSYWWQVPGRAIVGTLAGAELSVLAAQTMSWSRWRELHPETLILSEQTGFPINYHRDPFVTLPDSLNDLRSPFPSTYLGQDERLSPATRVLGVEVGTVRRVYAIELLGDAVLNDRVGGSAIAVFADAQGNGGVAFLAAVGGRELTFERDAEGIRDRETGSRWGLDGRATEGELAGSALEPALSRSTFWFAYIGAFPDAELHVP